MLADLLEESTPQLIQRVQARATGRSAPETPSARGRSGPIPALLTLLVSTLRSQRVDVPLCASFNDIGVEVGPFLAMVNLLKDAVYDLIEEHGLAVPPREIRLFADWFVAVTERTLRAENRRFAAMLDALPDHLLLQDPEGRLLYLNRATAEAWSAIHGWSQQEMIGLTADDFGIDERFQRYTRHLRQRVLGGEAVAEEFRLPEMLGGTWHEHHVMPVLDGQGHVEAIAIASRDIHARKTAEARLELLSKVGTLAGTTEYEGVLTGVARLAIPELADWCVIEAVEDGHVRYGKVAHRDPTQAALAEEILRSSPGQPDLPGACDVPAGGLLLAEALEDASVRERDPQLYQVVRRFGATTMLRVPLVVLGAPVAIATFVFTPESGRRHGPGDVAIAQEVARRAAQIIENTRLHERLRQSEARFRITLQHSNITVWEEDTDFRICWIYNPQFGLDQRNLIGKTGAGVFPPETWAELLALRRRVLATGEGARTAVDAVIGGERRKLLISYEPLWVSGSISGITATSVDVTEVTRIQEELAQEVTFRERVMGILGHDLRNPLSSVLALSELLALRDDLPDRTKEGLQHIRQTAERMNEMIATILDFTSIRFRCAPPLSPEPLELDALARTIVDELRNAHPGREIYIDAKGDLRGRWDRVRVGQVISNVVGNALVHGPRESPVHVSLAGENGCGTIAVSNRGPTIPPGHLDRLFEPFWQTPDQGEARQRGLGLGLFIVRQIVRAHGGEIAVRSQDGVTTFTVRLPHVPAVASNFDEADPAQGAERQGR